MTPHALAGRRNAGTRESLPSLGLMERTTDGRGGLFFQSHDDWRPGNASWNEGHGGALPGSAPTPMKRDES